MSRSWGLWKLERIKLGIWSGTWDSSGVHGRVYSVVEAGRTCTMVLLGPEIQRNAAPHMPDHELIIFAATSPAFRIDGLTVFTDYRLVTGQQDQGRRKRFIRHHRERSLYGLSASTQYYSLPFLLHC